MLTLGAQTTLDTEAFGYDEFSGTRRLFLSKDYTVNDIKVGPFDQGGLTVRQNSEPGATAETPDKQEGD